MLNQDNQIARNQEQLKNQNFTNFVTNMKKLKNAFLLLGFAYKAKR
jgi:hypothetical protein